MPDESRVPIDIPELRVPFVFRQRPVSLPADLRPAWRIGLILLLLKKCCRQRRTSLTRLHVLSWGFVSPEGRSQLVAAATGTLSPDSLVIRFEPFLLQAVDYGIGEGLVRRHGGGTIELTETGLRLAEELEENPSAFVSEKKVMATLRTRVSEHLVKRMFGWREDA
ncbi:hypothetical protein [Rosistilla oblonga]|uniref:hypothetical protein n=1 Tax=Rosistilla oblonga TaxID=2527990 RepID=UPI0011A32D05|nr:hypothetical protein [Rosistilla oblonga]